MNLSDIASYLNGELKGDPNIKITGVASFKEATSSDITLLFEKKFLKELATCKASALITSFSLESCPIPYIHVQHSKYILSSLISLFYPSQKPSYIEGISSHAIIGSNVHLGKRVTIEPFVVIQDHCVIEDDVVIKSHCAIGGHCHIGKGTYLHPHVTLYDRTILKEHVIVHSGAILGSDGFGYIQENGLQKIQHVGYVFIENAVEIGANTTIDRGCLGKTEIKEGSKIDNLVHIAHNCSIGKHSAIAAQVGMTGSSVIGNNVQIGGQSGIHRVTVEDGAIITARAGVTKDVPSSQIVSGFPAWKHQLELKKEAYLRKLVKEGESL